MTDGTPGGTTMLTSAAGPFTAGQPTIRRRSANFVTAGSKVYLRYADGAGDYFLYSTDGTVAGTNQIPEPLLSDSVGPGRRRDWLQLRVHRHVSPYNGLYITNGSSGNQRC